jgi:hypothetical protein
MMGHKTEQNEIDEWSRIVVREFHHRRAVVDPVWRAGERAVRGGQSRSIKGNLVSDLVSRLSHKIISAREGISIKTDDPTKIDHADRSEIVARSLSRIIKLSSAYAEATVNASWGLGVVEVGHPTNLMSADPLFTNLNDVSSEKAYANAQDVWETVSPDEIKGAGLDIGQVAETDAVDNAEDPVPLFGAGLGYPWAKSIDPRLIVVPRGTRQAKDAPWIARLKFVTRAELKATTGFSVKKNKSNGAMYETLFRDVEPDSEIHDFPGMLLVCDLYIVRDRNNPKNNGQFVSFLLGDPTVVIFNGSRPLGGMIPFCIFNLEKTKRLYDNSIAIDLMPWGRLYNMSLQAMETGLKRAVNRPLLMGRGHGVDDNDRKKLQNPDFQGMIDVNDPDQIRRHDEQGYDVDIVRFATWIKSSAQARSNVNEMDEGRSIKDVTARQTDAILDAVGVNISGMASQVSTAFKEGLMKSMHLLGIFSTAAGSMQFQFGGNFTSFDKGRQDFTNSLIYDVEVDLDNKELTAEERMVIIQFIRTVYTTEQLSQFADHGYLFRELAQRFGFGDRVHRGATGQKPDPLASMPMGAPSSQSAGQAQGGQVIDMVQGQHPERAAGSQGVTGGTGNLVRGGFQTGTGMGER